MVQKRRERALRGGFDIPVKAMPTPGPLTAALPTRRRGRDRVVAFGTAATLAAVAGVAGWRLSEGDADSKWAQQAQSQLGSVDQQLALLAQTTEQWQIQPAAVTSQRPDIAAALSQRHQELADERADLAAQLNQYRQLPSLRARVADEAARASALQHQLEDQRASADQAARDRVAALLASVRAQQAQDALEARTAADAVAAARAIRVPEDSGKTAAVVGVVASVLNQRPTPPLAPNYPPPNVQIEAAGPNLQPGAFAAAGGQPAVVPDAPAPRNTEPNSSPAALSPTAPAGAALPSAPSSPVSGVRPQSSAPATSRVIAPVRTPPAFRPAPPRILPSGSSTGSPVRRDGQARLAPASDNSPAAQPHTETRGEDVPATQRTAAPAAQDRPTTGDRPVTVPAALPRTAPPASLDRDRAQVESRPVPSQSSVPTEEEVKSYTGSKWIAKQSQSPEGQAMMRSLFGGDDANSETASDRSSVRRDVPQSRGSDSGSNAWRATTHSKTRESGSDGATTDSANTGSDATGAGADSFGAQSDGRLADRRSSGTNERATGTSGTAASSARTHKSNASDLSDNVSSSSDGSDNSGNSDGSDSPGSSESSTGGSDKRSSDRDSGKKPTGKNSGKKASGKGDSDSRSEDSDSAKSASDDPE